MKSVIAMLAATFAVLAWGSAPVYSQNGDAFGGSYCADSQAGTEVSPGVWCGYFCDGYYTSPPHLCYRS
jgi:hypothetical protein